MVVKYDPSGSDAEKAQLATACSIFQIVTCANPGVYHALLTFLFFGLHAGWVHSDSAVIQPVPWKMRLGMVIGMQNEILIGIKKLPFYVSFQIFKWKET